ncbi:complex proteins associated with Set1p component shg1-domain-containing protein [Leptodontidium sp. MPI-SDFR-AT-0119]|nr:complex proteins associated with Set1p component shg1-domain-containing protein [Leptodontidium sp. MPI-SDFR-AT-0119]
MATMMGYSNDAAAESSTGPVRKKLKTSDIPLSSATRLSIDELAHKFKKKGGYDSLRKHVWEDLGRTDFEKEFTQSLLKVAEDEIEKNPSQLLKLDRGKAAALIEGAVDRAGVYQTAESRIDALIDAHIEDIETGIRGLRREDVGEEVAAAEHARGGKTDEQYAEDAANRREAREKVRQEARAKELAVIDEKRREERAKRKEQEKKEEAEQERRRAEREAKRKAEREREEEKEKDLRERDRERDRDRDRDRERDRDRDRGRDRDRDRDRDDRYKRYDDPPSRRDSTRDTKESSVKPELSKEDIDRLEQEALNDLLKEGKKLSQRSRHQMEVEIDETLAPPPKKATPASAINPISRDSPAKSDIKKPIAPPTGPKADAFKTPHLPTDRLDDRRRSRSRDRASTRRSSRSRSRRRHDSRDRDSRRRRDSREDRRRRSSRDRSYSPDRRRSYRSDSRNREKRDRDRSRDRVRPASPPPRDSDLEKWKVAEAKKREEQAKAYKIAQEEARKNGLPVPGWSDRSKRDDGSPPRRTEDTRVASPVSARKRESSRERERERSSRARSRSRSPAARRGSRIERSTSPINIDRYVPGAASRSTRRDKILVDLVKMRKLVGEADQEVEVVVETGIGRGLDRGAVVRIRREIGGIEAGVVIGIGIGDVTGPGVGTETVTGVGIEIVTGVGTETVIGSDLIGVAVEEADENLPGEIRVRWMCTI